MELNDNRLIAMVNLLVDATLPRPDDPDPVGPWGPWIREALNEGPLPDPWRPAAAPDGHWWQEHHPGPPPYGTALLQDLAGQVDDHANPFGGRRPRPNWVLGALLRDLASLNPQPLPPVDGGIGFAAALARTALRHARQAGGDQGGHLLRRFAEDWCGTVIRLPKRPTPGGGEEPRPPRPQESLVLGAALVRAADRADDEALKRATEDAGRKIFAKGLADLG